MSWAPRPDPALMTGTFDTTDTAGPDAAAGHVEQVSAAFEIARAVDLVAAARQASAARQLPDMQSPSVRALLPDAERRRREALIAAERAQASLARRGLRIGPTGQPERLAPVPSPPPGAGAAMLSVDEES